jgi:hypothetical protein
MQRHLVQHGNRDILVESRVSICEFKKAEGESDRQEFRRSLHH